MCNAGYRLLRHEIFGVSPIPIAIGIGLHYLCLARLVAIHARGQKKFPAQSLSFNIDTQACQANGMGRGVHGPDGVVPRFAGSGYLHITSNYITVRQACAELSRTSRRSLKRPDQRSNHPSVPLRTCLVT